MNTEDNQTADKFWDDFYNKKGQAWSGNANPQLVRIASTLEAGTALDLGCGEGGDTLWLAKHGWAVTATDISEVALTRAKALVDQQHVGDKVTVERHDFEHSFPTGKYDLVSAQFLQSPVEFQRQKVLQKAATAVSLNGTLLIVEHGSAPSFSEYADHTFPSAKETFRSLELDSAKWEVVEIASPKREISSPSGQTATIVDNVIALKRIAN